MAFWDGWLNRKDSTFRRFMSIGKLGRPAWTPRNYESFAKEAYSQNVVAFRCIRHIAEAVGELNILAFEGRKENTSHPFLELLDQPNPMQSQSEFLDAITSYMLLAGNSYIEGAVIRDELRELYVHRPDRIKIIPGSNGWPAAFEYEANGRKKTIRVNRLSDAQQKMLHLKTFNPTDDWYGMSPVEPGAFAIDVHNTANGFNKALLDNAGSPSGAFVYENEESGAMMPKSQYDKLKENIDARFSGAKNAGRPMLLEGGLKWVPIGTTPKELEFLESKAAVAREICLAFGVPPMILGIPGDNTYSNYQEANRALYRDTVIPMAGRILKSLSVWARPTYPKLKLKVDLDSISALAGERKELWDRTRQSDFMSIGEKRKAMGMEPYDPQEKDAASRILVNGGMIPLEDVIIDDGDDDPNAGGEEPKEDEDGDEE